jgi:hypothetical protein
MEPYCTPKSQYITVKHSQQLFEHTYMSDPHGLGTLTPIEFFQQDLLWQSSNTHSHSCSHKASKHTRSICRRAIGPLAHHNGTSAYSPSLTCTSPDDRMSSSSMVLTRMLLSRNFPIWTQSSNQKESVAKYTSALEWIPTHTVISVKVPNTTNLVTKETPVRCCVRNHAAFW